MQVENTVFISYRRTNTYMARAVYQNLTANGYDCFLDVELIDAGSFTQIIFNQIAARAHFVLILTPSALERCVNPDDMVRREIEQAIDQKRNIVPLLFDNFDYGKAQQYMTGKLAVLPQYNSVEVPLNYFEEALARLRTRFLSQPLDTILFPTPVGDQQAVSEAQANAQAQPAVTEANLSAEAWFERGSQRDKSDSIGKIADFSQAIALNPQFAEAYYNRGIAYFNQNNFEAAIGDYDQSVALDATSPESFNNRGVARRFKGDLDGAIADYSAAIHLNPQYAEAYDNRGIALKTKGDLVKALADYDELLRLRPNAIAYYNRGAAWVAQQDWDKALADFEAGIQLTPEVVNNYVGMGGALYNKGDVNGAIAAFEKALALDPKHEYAARNLQRIRESL